MAKRRRKVKQATKKFKLLVLFVVIGIGAYYSYTYFVSPPRKIIQFDHLPALPEGFNAYGIDVSHHQGEIDWDTFFASNDSIIQFVYCKVTEGKSHVDQKWSENRERLISEKMPNGGYHFFIPSIDPLTQAKNFLSQYHVNQSDLPPALDVEVEGTSDVKLISSMMIWLKEVERVTGKRPIIYTSYNFYSQKFKDSLDGYLFWVANYSKRSDRFKDDKIIHWQFSETGKIPGITGYVDLNYSKIDF